MQSLQTKVKDRTKAEQSLQEELALVKKAKDDLQRRNEHQDTELNELQARISKTRNPSDNPPQTPQAADRSMGPFSTPSAMESSTSMVCVSLYLWCVYHCIYTHSITSALSQAYTLLLCIDLFCVFIIDPIFSCYVSSSSAPSLRHRCQTRLKQTQKSGKQPSHNTNRRRRTL